jgi:hypothetical protein
MKRLITGGMLFLGAVSGCVTVDQGPETGGPRPNYGRSFGPPSVPGVQGPYGAPVPMASPYNLNPPTNPAAAMAMISANVPLSAVQMHSAGGMPGVAGMPMTPIPQGGMIGPPGMPALPGMPGSSPFQPTGGISPMDGGLQRANVPAGGPVPGGVTQTQFANSSPVGPLFPAQRTQVQFAKPGGMKVYWFTQGADGKPSYSETPLETPGRYNFAQGAIYRLKLTRIPGRPALELYPTLEVVPTGPKTNEFLAHNSVPIEFSEDDFKQVVDRNYIVKVIYLPDPSFQDAAGAGPDEIVSSRLEPGQDPIQEALRRGSILLVLRIGNIDQGLVSSPGLTAPVPGGSGQQPMPGAGMPPLFQVPFGPNGPIPGGPMPFGPGGPMPFGPGGPLMPPGGVNLPPPNNLPPLPPVPGVAPAPLNLPPAPLPAQKGLTQEKLETLKAPALPGIDTPPPVVAPPITSGAPGTNPLVVPAGGAKDDLRAPSLPMLPSVTLPPMPSMQPAEESRSVTPLLPNVPSASPAASSDRPALPPVPTVPTGPEKN